MFVVQITVPAPVAPSRRFTVRFVAMGAAIAPAEAVTQSATWRTPAAPADFEAVACTLTAGVWTTDHRGPFSSRDEPLFTAVVWDAAELRLGGPLKMPVNASKASGIKTTSASRGSLLRSSFGFVVIVLTF